MLPGLPSRARIAPATDRDSAFRVQRYSNSCKKQNKSAENIILIKIWQLKYDGFLNFVSSLRIKLLNANAR